MQFPEVHVNLWWFKQCLKQYLTLSLLFVFSEWTENFQECSCFYTISKQLGLCPVAESYNEPPSAFLIAFSEDLLVYVCVHLIWLYSSERCKMMYLKANKIIIFSLNFVRRRGKPKILFLTILKARTFFLNFISSDFLFLLPNISIFGLCCDEFVTCVSFLYRIYHLLCSVLRIY